MARCPWLLHATAIVSDTSNIGWQEQQRHACWMKRVVLNVVTMTSEPSTVTSMYQPLHCDKMCTMYMLQTAVVLPWHTNYVHTNR